ncbi:heavy-metal-associated domain-containing protein [Roseateles sp.]|uniref:heavy-metal-associated domain-containing protein n=1 Tax=Roseateles sp. TaxID=1971397 RepID=UPI0039E95483
MISFEVNDMTCGHCVSTLTKALKAVDAGARVHIDLASHRIQIEPAQADADELADAIREAGYTPAPVAGVMAAMPASSTGTCCCR